jgi:outer membrane protein
MTVFQTGRDFDHPSGGRRAARFMRVAWVFSSALLAWGVTQAMAQTAVQDLATAYQQAASSSPMIAQARAQMDAELAGKPLARSALLPHVNAFASGGMNTGRVTGFGAQTISTGYHSDIFSASLTESLFDGQSFVALKQADSRIQASEAALVYAPEQK